MELALIALLALITLTFGMVYVAIDSVLMVREFDPTYEPFPVSALTNELRSLRRRLPSAQVPNLRPQLQRVTIVAMLLWTLLVPPETTEIMADTLSSVESARRGTLLLCASPWFVAMTKLVEQLDLVI